MRNVFLQECEGKRKIECDDMTIAEDKVTCLLPMFSSWRLAETVLLLRSLQYVPDFGTWTKTEPLVADSKVRHIVNDYFRL